MFKKLKGFLLSLFVRDNKKQTNDKNKKHSKNLDCKYSKDKTKNSSPQTTKSKVKKEEPKKKNKKKTKSNNINQNIIPKREIPQKPNELNDVELCEGKVRFLDLPLHKDVQFGIQNAGFKYCTAIQAMALPPLLEGKDLAGKAQTGTGKTAAFLLAGFDYMLKNPILEPRKNGDVRMLVLAPTRELAMQIHKDAESLGIFTELESAVLFGGMDYDKQLESIRKPLDLVIATPGRLIDYWKNSCINLSKVEILVIDEADRMLDMGFIPDVRRIVAATPPKTKRKTMFFSATLDDNILRLSSSFLSEPVILESEPEKMVGDNIEQIFYSSSRDEKLAVILYLLNNEKYERVIIFGNRKDMNLRLQNSLYSYGYKVPVLSGDISQEKRISILEQFRSGKEKIIIATDVAARGIHVDNVSLVINYDLPERSEDYVHRIGRTGRAGKSGKAISLLCEYGCYYLPAIEDLLKTRFTSTPPTDEMLVMPEVKNFTSMQKNSQKHRTNQGQKRKKW